MEVPGFQQKFEFTVNFTYRLLFSENVFDPTNQTLTQLIHDEWKISGSPKLICFLDQGLHESQPDLQRRIQTYFKSGPPRSDEVNPILIPGGEQAKNQREVFDLILERIHDAKICRHSYVIVVGGGSVIDAVCFAASIVHRGVRQIRIPTTVLAQDDAGIGVKNGINAFDKKNFLGNFDPPFAVINDVTLLTTLDQKNWVSGMAEAVKVALIKDSEFFHWIREHTDDLVTKRDLLCMKKLIQRSAELHLRHITTSGDPFEKGSARPLDFGHWVAHKLEQLSRYQLPHGHAVAIGMAVDAGYSRRKGFLTKEDEHSILECLQKIGFQTWHPLLLQKNSTTGEYCILEGLVEFREHLGGELTITLLKGIGQPFEIHEMDEALVLESIKALK